MDSLYVRDPNGLRLELATYTFTPPPGCSAADVLAVAHKIRGARVAFHLPYYDARMVFARDDGTVRYTSTRTHRGAPPPGDDDVRTTTNEEQARALLVIGLGAAAPLARPRRRQWL
jgi:Uncharacterized conserved protein (COG2071)